MVRLQLISSNNPTQGDRIMKEKIFWLIGGGVLILAWSLVSGGIYTITSPNGPVDAAYKINRFTGQVWLVKTYATQVGQIRVIAARQAEVEKTRDLAEADLPPIAMNETAPPTRGARNR
jgi:hypothetical protein